MSPSSETASTSVNAAPSTFDEPWRVSSSTVSYTHLTLPTIYSV